MHAGSSRAAAESRRSGCSGVVKVLTFFETPPMKIILFPVRWSPTLPGELRRLFDAIHAFGFDYALNEEFAPIVRRLTDLEIPEERIYGRCVGPQPEGTVMVCYGGDGTLLEGVHRLCGPPVPVMGINAGHLGFLTSAPRNGLDQLFGQIARGEFSTEARSMLSVAGDFLGRARPASGTQRVHRAAPRCGDDLGRDLRRPADGGHLPRRRTDRLDADRLDGLLAQRRGPVIAPTCRCLVLSPLAPHNLTMRPVVIPDESVITLRVHVRHSEAFATLDNRTCPIAAEGSSPSGGLRSGFFWPYRTISLFTTRYAIR